MFLKDTNINETQYPGLEVAVSSFPGKEFMFQILFLLKGVWTKGKSECVRNITETQVLTAAIAAATVCGCGQ